MGLKRPGVEGRPGGGGGRHEFQGRQAPTTKSCAACKARNLSKRWRTPGDESILMEVRDSDPGWPRAGARQASLPRRSLLQSRRSKVHCGGPCREGALHIRRHLRDPDDVAAVQRPGRAGCKRSRGSFQKDVPAAAPLR